MLSRRKLLVTSGTMVPYAAFGAALFPNGDAAVKPTTMKTFSSIGKGSPALDGHHEATLLESAHVSKQVDESVQFRLGVVVVNGGSYNAIQSTRIHVIARLSARRRLYVDLLLG